MILFPEFEMFSDAEEFAFPLPAKCKLRGHKSSRTGVFRTNSETMTRKPDSSEIDFERHSSRRQVVEQECAKYRLTNMIHKLDVRRETIDRQDLVRHKEETRETKIFIIERRSATGAGLIAQAIWKQLKRLVCTKTERDAIEAAPAAEIENRKPDGVAGEASKAATNVPNQKAKFPFPKIVFKQKQHASGDEAAESHVEALSIVPTENETPDGKLDDSNLPLPVPSTPSDSNVKEQIPVNAGHSTKKLFIQKLIPAKKKQSVPVPVKA